MVDRLLLSLGIILLGVALVALARAAHLHGLGRRLARARQSTAPGLTAFRPGRPAVLYFSTESCAPCHTVLKPALKRLCQELGHRFQVLEVDAELQPEAARYWRVLSVPTVFVLDPHGQPRHVHYGVARPEVLRAQLGDWLG